ncbi:MAG: hypothetical protein KG003_11995 [Bacteroidetes bacterium]|nr:hypothetical protein [Bacteroidota bacterium]
METVFSKNNVPIRLTAERWIHIVENHDDVAGLFDDVLTTVEEPNYIIQGYNDALIALRVITKNKYFAVVYKETSHTDGFIITAYFTNKLQLDKETILWQKK